MKTFKVVQQYANIPAARRNEKLALPLPLGNYEGRTITSALNKAAKDWKLPALLLHATLADIHTTRAQE